jgi:glycosyltransferase involved in cell wall biosynthesis
VAYVITVLLCTHNGARFLGAQLDSLLAQTRPASRIVISDDASTDGTWEILQRYAAQYPHISIRRHATHQTPDTTYNATPQIEIRTELPFVAPVAYPPLPPTARNFLDLMVAERNDYLMLCDQDDVWHTDKIARTLAKLNDMEARHGATTPCLTHTDLTVVDESLHVINPSFRAAMDADWTRTTLRDQIVQNTATGCTIMYNRALANLLTEVPRYAVMHDWWLPLVACAFGYMEPLATATIDYRQHAHNVIGATDMRTFRYKLHRALNLDTVRHAVRITYPQAAELLRIYAPQLKPADAAMLASYANLPAQNKLARLTTVIRERFWKSGLPRNLAYLLVL